MATPRPPRVTSGEASIAKGRQAYAEGQHKTAIEHFTLVANACPCNRGGRRERCKCKRFETIARDGGSIFNEAMHQCSCGVSNRYKKCHEPSHVQCLDYRAAVFEKMGRLELAKKDAEWLLEIAPRSLEGYLRLGKVYRLEREPELALAFWNAGIEVGAKEGHGGSAKLKQLFDARAPLQKRFGRKDPMELPLEIVENIFSYLDFRELCRAHGVCKRWDVFFGSRTRLWRHISFPNNLPTAPSLEFLRKISKRSASGAISLVVPRTRALQLTQAKWHALLQASLAANHMELGLVNSFVPEMPSDSRILSRLVSLRLSFSALENRRELHLVLAMLEHAKDSLESLWVDQAPYLRSIPVLSRLKYLRISGECEKHSIPRELHAIGLAKSTPCLEQLHIANYLLRNNQDFDDAEFSNMWPSLEAVVVEHQVMGPITDHTNRRIFPPLRSLRAFESRTLEPTLQAVPFPHNLLVDYGLNPPPDDPSAGHREMQRFWVEGVSITPALRSVLEPAITSGSLRELGLCFPDHRSPDWGSADQPAQAFLEQVPWLQGAESVRTLGLFSFNLDTNLALPDSVQSAGQRRLPERDQAKLLVKFIETFPNLETLVLASDLCVPRHIAVMIEAVAQQGRVKKFYAQNLMGSLLDQMRAFAADKGVEILHHREVSPWPVPLEGRRTA